VVNYDPKGAIIITYFLKMPLNPSNQQSSQPLISLLLDQLNCPGLK